MEVTTPEIPIYSKNKPIYFKNESKEKNTSDIKEIILNSYEKLNSKKTPYPFNVPGKKKELVNDSLTPEEMSTIDHELELIAWL